MRCSEDVNEGNVNARKRKRRNVIKDYKRCMDEAREGKVMERNERQGRNK